MDKNDEEKKRNEDFKPGADFWNEYAVRLKKIERETEEGFTIGYHAHEHPEIAKVLESLLQPGSPLAKGYFAGKEKEISENERAAALLDEMKLAREEAQTKEKEMNDRDDMEL